VIDTVDLIGRSGVCYEDLQCNCTASYRRSAMRICRESSVSSAFAALALLAVFACCTATLLAADQGGTKLPSRDFGVEFGRRIRPTIAKYCLDCHSTKEKKGELDLERFASLAEARRDLRPWQSLVEMLEAKEMPPTEKPQPSADERKLLIEWAREFVAAEARARAGDPGPALLRRLSNAEYDRVIEALTSVDLRPAKEFPADGAAGEGFTNAAAALTMSPALVDKYFAAAKAISEHAVLLPGGIRFSPASHEREWVDEILGQLRAFYARYAESDGRIPLRRYLAATIAHREALAGGERAFREVAEQEHLSVKYLESLWSLLTDSKPSFIFDDLRARWRKATVADVTALAEQIEAWQQAAWTLETNAPGLYEQWQKPKPLLVESQSLRIKLDPPPGRSEVTLYLLARDAGGKDDRPIVLWGKPRFERAGDPPLPLRDVGAVSENSVRLIRAQFGDAARYLAAAAEWHRSQPGETLKGVAERHAVDVTRLRRWLDALGLRRDEAITFELLDQKVVGSGDRAAINGWAAKTPDSLPSLVTNSSDQTQMIPGTVGGHQVAMHPAPKEFVGVIWRSPIEADVKLETIVADAHAGCGNGVAWWLVAQHGDRAVRLVGGEFDDGKAATIPPQSLHVALGDLVLLAVGPRDGDHTCDLTHVDLTIIDTADPRRRWSLGGDNADNVLDGNPHADHLGNKDTWRFVRGPDIGSSPTPITLPASSALARWREALSNSATAEELAKLGDAVQSLLTNAARISPSDSDGAVYAALSAPERRVTEPVPLARLLDESVHAASAHSHYGIDPALFGKSISGQAIDGASFEGQAGEPIAIRLPASLVAKREFVVEARAQSACDSSDAFVQVQASIAPISAIGKPQDGPVITSARDKQREAQNQRLAEFRRLFPPVLCFAGIVPQDPDGITLRLFCREDGALADLMLEPAERKELDRIWNELTFVGREAEKEQEAYPQFMEYASQVGLVPRFAPLKEPVRHRAEQFRKVQLTAEPQHFAAVLDFAARAYRRPLAEWESAELQRLYDTLRKKDVTHDAAIRAIIARVLVSPDFLFHIEKAPAGESPQPVTDWELASRLSFFFWSSAPDDELQRLAAENKLHEPAILAEQTRRMLKDPKIRALAIEFGAQWIGVRGFDELKEKNERLFPTFDAKLRAAIYEETILFFQELFQGDRPLHDVLDADYTFVNETLAKHYRMPGVAGPEWRRVDGVRQYGRGGILGLASVQATEAGASRTSPVLRGNWVGETLLGERLPRPPANVPRLPEEETGNDGLSMRQLVEKHTRVASCAVCHMRIDPFGFSLERYDAIGRFREKDLGGVAIDCRVKLRDGTEFEGLDGLRDYLLTKKRDVVNRLFCLRLLGYALGRAVSPADQPTIDEMLAAMDRNEGRLSAAVLAIVASPQFRLIRGRDFMGGE
jgi:hypothetical protein